MRLKVESDFQTNESRPRYVSQDCRLRGVYSDTTQLNSTSSGVELSCVAINTPLVCEALMSTMHVVTCNLAGETNLLHSFDSDMFQPRPKASVSDE